MRQPARASLRSGIRAWVIAGLLAQLASLSSCSKVADPAGEAVALAAGGRFERVVEGASVALRFECSSGSFLQLEVEQMGIDVVAYLYGPDGSLLFEVDSPTGASGVESLTVVVRTGGLHRLVAEPLHSDASGRIAVTVAALREATELDRQVAAASAALARAERRRLEGDHEAAAAGYEQALPHLAELEDAERTATAEWRLGESLLELGLLRSARRHLEAARTAFAALGDARGEARVLNDLGAVERRLGHLEAARQSHKRSLDLYRQLDSQSGEASALNNLALVAETRGDLGEAAELLEDALAIWRRLGRRSAEAATLQNLGSLHSFIGRDAEGLDLLSDALALRLEAGRDRHYLSALVELGWASYLAGNAEQAIKHYEAAEALSIQLADRATRAGVLDRKGTALRALGRLDEAEDAYRAAVERSGDTGSASSNAHTLANLGWLRLEQGNTLTAKQLFDRALESLGGSGESDARAYTLVGLARAERAAGHLARARERLYEALELIESLRTGVRRGLSRSYFLAVRYDVVEELVELLLDLHRQSPGEKYDHEALEVAERARSRSLVEAAADRDTSRTSGTENRARDDLLAEITALEARRAALADQDSDASALRRLEKALRQRWIEMERFAAAEATTRQPRLTATQIQKLLDPETVLLAFFLAEPESIAWTVDQETVVTHRLAGRGQVEQLAGRAAALLYRSRARILGARTERALDALASEVLHPVAERLEGRKRVAVLADGALGYVPLGALPLPSTDGDLIETLLDQSEVVTLPSASVLAAQRSSVELRKRHAGTLAVVADPVLGPSDERLVELDAAGWDDPQDLGPDTTSDRWRNLARLRHAGDEARAILSLVPLNDSFAALGFDADRTLVTGGSLAGYRLIHFATHGLLHPTHPELSGLVLSLIDERGLPRDGFLRAHEIAALRLPSDLVVLSACQTGLGNEIRGEGLVGLPHAFFRAGARAVVVSHWNVNDRATAVLMRRFYEGLLNEDLSPSAALRQAQLSIRAESGWRAPYYWAAFSLHGEWRR